MRKTNGITLISLIITIIVLLILAGVSISVLTGYDSIPDNAKTAVDTSRQDASEEQEMVDKIGGLFEKYLPTTGVYGNLYKISDTEYHLIFNSDGDIAEGYTEEQLVARGSNIVNGAETLEVSTGVWQSSQPWGVHSEKIKKVKIEEKIQPKSTTYYFYNLSTITEIEEISNIDISNVTNMRGMFQNCKSLTNIDVSEFNTQNVTDMHSMFSNCNNLTSLNVSGWNTRQVKDMVNLFCDCWNLTNVDTSEWNTSNVENMQGVFGRCYKLSNVKVENWNTNNVTNMYGVFLKCYKLTDVDVRNWDTSKVTNMGAMFGDCNELSKIYVSDKWNVSNVIDSSNMFANCTALSGAISYDANKTNATYANYTTGYLTYKANVDENGLARENITIKPSADSNLQIVIPKGMAPAILVGSNSTTSLPGQDGSVASIMPATDWNKITTEQIDKGIVIVDHAITYTNSVPDFNEFVWVPIPESSNWNRKAWITAYIWDDTGMWIEGTNTTKEHPLGYPSDNVNKWWEETSNEEYTNMVSSINNHKGFYIGRYEASVNGEIAQSKRGQTAKVEISQPNSIIACTNNKTINNMHLIYGIEWDSVLNWLNDNALISTTTGETKTMELSDLQTDSSTWGNYRDSVGNAASIPYITNQKQNTGASEYWKANNIYDLAGNVWELTQEKYSTGTYKGIRGGAYYGYANVHPVANRCVNEVDDIDSTIRF